MVISKLALPPLTYHFNTAPNTVNSSDRVFCHMFFNPSVEGNTVTWELINQNSNSPTIWSITPLKAAPTTYYSTTISATTISTTSSTSPASSAASAGSAGSTASGSAYPLSSSPTNVPGGLSTGAKAGIGIGVALGATTLIVLAIFWLFSRRRRMNRIAELSNPPLYPTASMKETQIHSHYRSPFELDGSPSPQELP
jgi:hypothetical protein